MQTYVCSVIWLCNVKSRSIYLPTPVDFNMQTRRLAKFPRTWSSTTFCTKWVQINLVDMDRFRAPFGVIPVHYCTNIIHASSLRKFTDYPNPQHKLNVCQNIRIQMKDNRHVPVPNSSPNQNNSALSNNI